MQQRTQHGMPGAGQSVDYITIRRCAVLMQGPLLLTTVHWLKCQWGHSAHNLAASSLWSTRFSPQPSWIIHHVTLGNHMTFPGLLALL